MAKKKAINRKASSAEQQQQHTKQTATERIIHDEEFGEEDVELVDSEWADFERFFRYIHRGCRILFDFFEWFTK